MTFCRPPLPVPSSSLVPLLGADGAVARRQQVGLPEGSTLPPRS
ncbi:hypothetical protein [Streptacidiphilus jiangxiensis]|uniref:Uncharacterized protein n=1 Tax=Streptacidiphilus jiangxiensis TaxID=235985 RepID=A0A1H7HRI0_STRJI|nr:hypothetical protein [Streptacidiphilus jiangxiensis]SEK51630.1 hypothetical protein SAMN05414137_102279 [Streptacidiphilus jiangxiensis]